MSVDTEEWTTLEKAYEQWKSTAEAAVVEWQYASIAANWERPIPFWNAIYGSPLVTRVRSRPPANPATAEHYGIDASGRIVVARSFNGYGTLASEELFDASDGLAPVLLSATRT